MPRFYAPDHHDCWIDCEDSGNAVYVDPPGVCLAQCGEGSLVSKLVEVAKLSSLISQIPTISILGETERDRLLNLSAEYNNLKDSDNTYTDMFGPISQILSAVNSFPNASGFTYGYKGPRSDFSKGIAKSLQPRGFGESQKR